MEDKHKTFNNAVKRFKSFLTERGFSPDIRWVFREDVAMHRAKLWVRLPLPQSNPRYAEKLFYVGSHRGLGLKFSRLATVGSESLCYLLVPQDVEDAECMMLSGGLQFTCPDPLKTARVTKGGMLWPIRKWRGDKWLTHLPRRKDLGSMRIPAEILPPTEPKLLFVVDDYFTIKGRGIVLMPGVPIDEHGPFVGEEIIFKVGDKVELRKPDGSILKTEIAGADSHSFKRMEGDLPEEHCYLIIHFKVHLERSDAPNGTEVWIADQ